MAGYHVFSDGGQGSIPYGNANTLQSNGKISASQAGDPGSIPGRVANSPAINTCCDSGTIRTEQV